MKKYQLIAQHLVNSLSEGHSRVFLTSQNEFHCRVVVYRLTGDDSNDDLFKTIGGLLNDYCTMDTSFRWNSLNGSSEMYIKLIDN